MSKSTFLPKGYSKLPTKERYDVVQKQINKVGIKDTFSDFARIARYRTHTSSGTTYQQDLNHLMASLSPEDCPDDFIFSVLTNKCIKNTKKNRETQASIKANLSKLPIFFKEKGKSKLPSKMADEQKTPSKRKSNKADDSTSKTPSKRKNKKADDSTSKTPSKGKSKKADDSISKTPSKRKEKITSKGKTMKKVRIMEDELTHLNSVMLADTFLEDKSASLVFPVYASTKIDGHRAIRVANRLLSRGMGDVPNIHIRNCLTRILPSGMDLELCSNNDLRETSKIVRHRTRKVEQLDVYILDWVTDKDLQNDVPFSDRYARLEVWFKEHEFALMKRTMEGCKTINIHLAKQQWIKDTKGLKMAYAAAVKRGDEGIMIRDINAPYTQSRSKGLLKWKRWADAEGKIIDVVIEPGAKRIKAFKVEWNGIVFKISSGLNSKNATEFFQQRALLKGKLAKFKYQDISQDGIFKEGIAPRHAVFLDIRDKGDLS